MIRKAICVVCAANLRTFIPSAFFFFHCCIMRISAMHLSPQARDGLPKEHVTPVLQNTSQLTLTGSLQHVNADSYRAHGHRRPRWGVGGQRNATYGDSQECATGRPSTAKNSFGLLQRVSGKWNQLCCSTCKHVRQRTMQMITWHCSTGQCGEHCANHSSSVWCQ